MRNPFQKDRVTLARYIDALEPTMPGQLVILGPRRPEANPLPSYLYV